MTQLTPERVMKIARECYAYPDYIFGSPVYKFSRESLHDFAARIAAEARRMALEEAACLVGPLNACVPRAAILALKEKP